jgi:hypothetical protein
VSLSLARENGIFDLFSASCGQVFGTLADLKYRRDGAQGE